MMATTMAAEQVGTAAVSEEVVSTCTKCKQALAHTIVSKVKQRIAKVKCHTCGTIHRYIDPTLPVKPKTPRKPAAQIAQEATYEKLIAMTAGQKGQPYSLSGVFKEHDVIEHSTFGRGIVTHLVPGNKIHVAFAQGEKLLVYRR
jgi:hypothetical protein